MPVMTTTPPLSAAISSSEVLREDHTDDVGRYIWRVPGLIDGRGYVGCGSQECSFVLGFGNVDDALAHYRADHPSEEPSIRVCPVAPVHIYEEKHGLGSAGVPDPRCWLGNCGGRIFQTMCVLRLHISQGHRLEDNGPVSTFGVRFTLMASNPQGPIPDRPAILSQLSTHHSLVSALFRYAKHTVDGAPARPRLDDGSSVVCDALYIIPAQTTRGQKRKRSWIICTPDNKDCGGDDKCANAAVVGTGVPMESVARTIVRKQSVPTKRPGPRQSRQSFDQDGTEISSGVIDNMTESPSRRHRCSECGPSDDCRCPRCPSHIGHNCRKCRTKNIEV